MDLSLFDIAAMHAMPMQCASVETTEIDTLEHGSRVTAEREN